MPTPTHMDPKEIMEFRSQVTGRISGVVVGHEATIVLMLAGLLARGHVLLEGVPGTAKTLMVKALAKLLGLKFARIQFTPDLMPSDIIGTSVFNPKTAEFRTEKGPLFTQFLLADEINRTPPRTQAALLEAMGERQVTLDGMTHALDAPFMTFATQNPMEHEGTYPLAESQIDRFALKIEVGYPDAAEESRVIREHSAGDASDRLTDAHLPALCTSDDILRYQATVDTVAVADDVVEYLTRVVRKTREHSGVRLGASPRGGATCMRVARALAALNGRAYVIPDDIVEVSPAALAHRVLLMPEAEIGGETGRSVLAAILQHTAVPR